MHNEAIKANRNKVLDLLATNRTIKPNTKESIATHVSKYIEFRNLKEPFTLEQMFDEAKTNPRKTIEEFQNHFYWQQGEEITGYPKIKKPTRASSAKVATYGKVASIFKHTGILIRIPSPQVKEKEAIQADHDYEFVKLDQKTKETYIDKTILQKFLNNLSPRDRAIGLCMLSSSQDSGDLFTLTVGQFRKGLNGEQVRFFWDNGRKKTGESFQVFFSKEATTATKQYLETERQGAQDDEPLFTKNGGGNRTMETGDLGENFRETARKVGIVWDNKKYQNPFRGKRLRHFFRDCAGEAGLETEYKHIFMGHVLSQNDAYNEPRAKLEQQYTKVEPYLLIFQNSEELEKTTKTLAETESIIKDLKEQLDKSRVELSISMSYRAQQKEEIEKIKMETKRLENEAIPELMKPYVEAYKTMKDEIDGLREEISDMRKANEERDREQAKKELFGD